MLPCNATCMNLREHDVAHVLPLCHIGVGGRLQLKDDVAHVWLWARIDGTRVVLCMYDGGTRVVLCMYDGGTRVVLCMYDGGTRVVLCMYDGGTRVSHVMYDLAHV